MRILLSGMIAGDPHQGGATWAVLQYVLGLRCLGHHVDVVEPVAKREVFDSSVVRNYFKSVADQFALTGGLLHPATNATFGFDTFGDYDLLINISGMLKHDVIPTIPVRLFLDLDPAFIQCWHAQGIDMNLAAHTHFATVGAAIGTTDCPVPTCGVDWIITRPPIVLEHWPRCEDAPSYGFTTIANWRGYGSVEHAGVVYGQKAHSLRRFLDLPRRTQHLVEPALAIHPGETTDIENLHNHGWTWLDPAAVAGTPNDYRCFVQQSRGEFGLAKAGYADSRCGWFSDRSAAYLASGRPVLSQNTGATGIPTGDGLLTFDSVESIVTGLDAIATNEAKHRVAARALAETYFDSDVVLTLLLERLK